MNAERPVYEQREFYGPLEQSRDTPQLRHRHMLEHPDDPSRLLRTTDGDVYRNKQDMDEALFMTQHVLRGLKKYGINHVNPSYIDDTTESGEPYLLIAVDKLKEFEPYRSLIKNGHLTTEQAHEADLVLTHMFEFLDQAMRENGYIDIEMMHLGQFVYDPSQPEGQRMVLVDVEPVGGRKIEMNKDSMEYGYPSVLAGAVAKLITDAIELAQKTGYPVESLQKAAEITERLPGDSEKTRQMKEDLLEALATRQQTNRLQYYVNDGMVDGDIDLEDDF